MQTKNALTDHNLALSGGWHKIPKSVRCSLNGRVGLFRFCSEPNPAPFSMGVIGGKYSSQRASDRFMRQIAYSNRGSEKGVRIIFWGLFRYARICQVASRGAKATGFELINTNTFMLLRGINGWCKNLHLFEREPIVRDGGGQNRGFETGFSNWI